MHRIQKSLRAWLVVACALACAPWVSISADARSGEEPAVANSGGATRVHVFRRAQAGTAEPERTAVRECGTAFSIDADGSFRTLHHFGRPARCGAKGFQRAGDRRPPGPASAH